MKYLSSLSLGLGLLAILLLAGCEKKEQPITLPAKGAALPGRVTMGEAYETQVFYDFETNSVVKTSEVSSWDLALESSRDGFHIWMNGGKGVLIANAHHTDFKSCTSLPPGITSASFLFDDPSGRADSTAVGDWRGAGGGAKGDLYLAKLNDTTYYKFRMLWVNDTAYGMEWSDIHTPVPQTIILRKDPAYSFTYFSFTGGAVMPDPPKNSWDVVFTRYRYIYRDLNNLPYFVNGALLNPYQTAAAADSVTAFSNITAAVAAAETAVTSRDAIGFDWKKYNFSTARYEVNPGKNYILHTRNGQLHKLHFLDFYSSTGVKGSPSFESERLQ